MRKYLNNILLGLVLVSSPLSASQGFVDVNVYEYTPKQNQTAVKTSQAVNNKSDIRIWVEKLEEYESNIIEDKDNYKRIDTNGYYSYACMQFQMHTFLHFYNLKNNTNLELYKNISLEEARNLISDCELQKDLATWMIKDNPNRWTHWRTSVERGLGLPPNHTDYTK